MTMPMNERFRLLSFKLKFPSSCLFFFNNEFLEQKRCLRDVRGMTILDEVRIFVPECQDAAGFAAHYQIPVFDKIIKLPDIKVGIFPRRFRETFRNHRPAATPALLGDANLITGSL